jgi:hypothetical protein
MLRDGWKGQHWNTGQTELSGSFDCGEEGVEGSRNDFWGLHGVWRFHLLWGPVGGETGRAEKGLNSGPGTFKTPDTWELLSADLLYYAPLLTPPPRNPITQKTKSSLLG